MSPAPSLASDPSPHDARKKVAPRKTPIRLTRDEGRLYLGKAPKRSRYTVAPREQRTIDGMTFASLAEARRYAELKLRERIGEIFDLRCQAAFDCIVNGVHVLTYTVDFAYRDAEGREVFEEVKSGRSGAERDWKLRAKLVEALHGVKINVVTI
jgi:hypothetical protein